MKKSIIRSISCILIICLLLPAQGFGDEEKIRYISVQADGPVIEIRYDLLPGREDKKYTVTIEISDDGGRTYDVEPYMITGDLGRDIIPGRHKRIVWMIEREFPNGLDLDRYEFRITANQQGIGRNLLYILAGAVVAGGSTAAYFIFGGDDEDDPFPTPPGRPPLE